MTTSECASYFHMVYTVLKKYLERQRPSKVICKKRYTKLQHQNESIDHANYKKM